VPQIAIIVDKKDNVATALRQLEPGSSVRVEMEDYIVEVMRCCSARSRFNQRASLLFLFHWNHSSTPRFWTSSGSPPPLD